MTTRLLALPASTLSQTEGTGEISATLIAVNRSVRRRGNDSQGDGYVWSAQLDGDQYTWNSYPEDVTRQLRSRVVDLYSPARTSPRQNSAYGAAQYKLYAGILSGSGGRTLDLYA